MRDAHKKSEIYDTGWIRKIDKVSDAITKVSTSEELEASLDTGILIREVTQWTIRFKPATTLLDDPTRTRNRSQAACSLPYFA